MSDAPLGVQPDPDAALGGRRWWLVYVVFLGGALSLVPWIVALLFVEPSTVVVDRVAAIRAGIAMAMTFGLLATAFWRHRRSLRTAVAASFTGVVAFVSAWFSVITTPDLRLPTLLFLLHVPIVVVCVLIVRRSLWPRPDDCRPARVTVMTFVLAGVAVIPTVIAIAVPVRAPRIAHNVGLVWSGLDIFELAAMAATAWCLRGRLRGLVVAATATGAFLLCDAWYDVMSSLGSAQWTSIAFAGVEAPLAILALVVAHAARRRLHAEPGSAVDRVAAGAEGHDRDDAAVVGSSAAFR